MFGMEHGASYRIRDNYDKKYDGPRPYIQEDWSHMLWLFDVNDFVEVKNGNKKPYELIPYDYQPLKLPFDTPTGIDGKYGIPRATIKNGCVSGNDVYFSLSAGDDSNPVIVKFTVNIDGVVEPPAPEPEPEPTMREDLHAAIDAVLDKYNA